MNTSINYSGFVDLLHLAGSEKPALADQYTRDLVETMTEARVEPAPDKCAVSAGFSSHKV